MFNDVINVHVLFRKEAKEKYRGMFETQKSGNKTSSGEIDKLYYKPRPTMTQFILKYITL